MRVEFYVNLVLIGSLLVSGDVGGVCSTNQTGLVYELTSEQRFRVDVNAP